MHIEETYHQIYDILFTETLPGMLCNDWTVPYLHKLKMTAILYKNDLFSKCIKI
jgi:hypothetical protein